MTQMTGPSKFVLQTEIFPPSPSNLFNVFMFCITYQIPTYGQERVQMVRYLYLRLLMSYTTSLCRPFTLFSRFKFIVLIFFLG